MSDELYRDFRPDDFGDIFGQSDAVTMLNSWVAARQVPHVVLFAGPSGCGKTTLARILKNKMKVVGRDFKEMNCAESRGIDDIRELQERLTQKPLESPRRVILLDECHALTKDAQNALLKTLEDMPKHMYFMLASTDPGKLLATIRTRCTMVTVKPLDDRTMEQLIKSVAAKINLVLDRDVIQRIREESNGSARLAIVLLNSIRHLTDPTEQLKAVEQGDHKTEAITLARALLNPEATWPKVSAILSGLKGEDCEGLRRMVLAYCQTILLSGRTDANAVQAARVMEALAKPIYDTLWPGLTLACWNLINRNK